MRKIFLMALGAVSIGALLIPASAKAADNPVVLELFTSQSCSSCPPADKLLSQLAEQDNVIALSCNVTYWNHLHWEDTLSKEFCTQRQRQYVQTLKSRGPYTPQIMINGRQTMVGSHGGKIEKSIAEEVKENPVKPIGLEISGDNLVITLPETPGDNSYALLLVPHGTAHHQEIPSGENSGRAVTYTNPVQDIISLGSWDGTGKTMNYDVSGLKDARGFVILAQENGVTGPIMAAAKIKVN